MSKKSKDPPPPPPPPECTDLEEERRVKAEEFPKTAPNDARYPNANVSYWCFQMFQDYHRCIQLFDEGHEPCDEFKKIFKIICPNAWIDRWEGQIKNGTFAGVLPNDCRKMK